LFKYCNPLKQKVLAHLEKRNKKHKTKQARTNACAKTKKESSPDFVFERKTEQVIFYISSHFLFSKRDKYKHDKK